MKLRAPKCHACKKPLVWTAGHYPLFVRRTRKELRKRFAAFRREERRLAIRCLFCLHIFCRRCAKKHFAPRMRRITQTEKVLDKILAGIVEANRAKLAEM